MTTNALVDEMAVASMQQRHSETASGVHVAASLFHDVQPCAALGLPCVWINRQDEVSDLPRAGELTSIEGLADVLDELVPAGDG